ncbi:hypothetical protein Sliba_00830 [Streptomyces nigrescens]|uniref:Uncharacterized protein n=1 Tax=Streptomyces nigrescens TaxID=1920 RepID=A0A640T8X3_STRNI|nr:hypothetical protein Sliba_00830 [Streptomyces libani subsp. libani]GGW04472.1 hypothetical protein GCM10010500_66590 [Streptomyces libani subsp. libani]
MPSPWETGTSGGSVTQPPPPPSACAGVMDRHSVAARAIDPTATAFARRPLPDGRTLRTRMFIFCVPTFHLKRDYVLRFRSRLQVLPSRESDTRGE